MTDLDNKVLKRDKQHELDIAIAEAELTKYLPFSSLGDHINFFFNNAITSRVVCDYIWATIERAGIKDPTVPVIVRYAARVCFSGILRAHLYVTEGQQKM